MATYDELKQAVFDGDFAKARSYLDLADFDDAKKLDDRLTPLCWDDQNEGKDRAYYFINYLILGHETAALHYVAALQLSTAYCWFNGVYDLACQHMRRALALSPDNFNYKWYMLFFYDVPEQPLTKEEALHYAREVLAEDPAVEVAQRILNALDQQSD